MEMNKKIELALDIANRLMEAEEELSHDQVDILQIVLKLLYGKQFRLISD